MPGPTQHSAERASVGKIARLPKAIREMLNRRLEDGEAASKLAAWLNELPPVQTVLASYFGGAAITQKNISNWRLTGFKRWQERQEILAEVRELSEEAADLNESNPDGLMRMTATLACTKLLRAIRNDKSGVEVTKAAFAIAALNNVEMSHVRVEHEEQRLAQKESLVTLAWDKHLRDCAAIADRIKGDEQIDRVKGAEFDNRDKIELIGRRMFGDLWKKRRLPWEDENFNNDEKELERMEASSTRGPSRDDGGQRTDGTNATDWTDGTDEPDSPSLPVNPYAGKTTQELIAEAESLGRNCRNTGSTCGVRSPDGPSASPDAHAYDTLATTPGVQLSEGNGNAEPEAKPTADQQVSPAITHVSPETVGGKDEVNQCQGSTAHACGVPPTLSPYEKALLDWKSFTEALYARGAPTPKPKDETPQSKPGTWGEGVCEPVHYAAPLARALPVSTGEDHSKVAAKNSTEPEYNLRDIEWLLRRGKTLEEARRILDARRRGIQEPTPMNDAPPPYPTEPFYGPCDPPSSLLYRLPG